ncbi:outer membrane usher protein [Salmonella enterica]|nr:outer membrane usher protein [Salmonella enterica]EHH6165070.1 outer membrane usher protein [Salmonella enterica]EHO7416038.1 outer membrane usher protein [Salmonella enterica]EHP0290045.1 outer membrane usher protein [Salmonella enterica]EHZ6479265.1 outer membrane usher protein [Salmonella enterica]
MLLVRGWFSGLNCPVFHPVAAGVLIAIQCGVALPGAVFADEVAPVVDINDIQFNTDVLDLNDRENIDLSQFSQAGYVMPGTYTLALQVNKSSLPERQIQFLVPDNNPKGSEACLTPEMVSQLGLKESTTHQLEWWHNNECLDPSSLKGMTMRVDLGAGTLYVSLPQAYLEYATDNWDPPSRWDEGVAGVLFDYSLNAQTSHQQQSNGRNNQSLSGNGTTGMNVGPWRLRADWQANYNHTTGATGSTQQNWDWSRYYVYRAIGRLRAKLTLGENYLSSGMFDSFRYTGASLVSDDNMLPPNLRGYAPEVTGVAKTNAKVTISQQGRVIYETTVASGPFRIQDLNNAITGKLDVKITEQDGSVHEYQVDTANVPYLTRPGLVRYKIASGKPSDYHHHSEGPTFGTGEFSWGVSNGWSLYGGSLVAGDYNALAVGIGRDLLVFGAISFDVTQSRAVLPRQETKNGGSYRVSYSKRFDETDSQVTFAGYRFSERNFMSMSQYLDARYHHNDIGGAGKELYTLTFNQQIRDLNMTAYINYSHQTYWNQPANDTYNVSLSRYFDLGQLKNLSLSLSAYRRQYNHTNDDGMFVGLSVPWGNRGMLSYDAQMSRGNSSNTVGYYDRIDDNTTYRVNGEVGQDGRGAGSGYITHDGELAEMSATAAFGGSNYSSLGMSVRGGMTATQYGAALHRVNAPGGTRMMVDTGGVSNVPVRGYGAATWSNVFGKAVVSDMSSYYRTSVNVDLDKLGNDVEATRSVVQGTLTEGAIGYRKFGVIAGQKAMAILKIADGSSPPFGATVLNADNAQTGLVSDGGMVWLSGIKAGETMKVNWEGEIQCQITIPSPLPLDLMNQQLLLPCKPVSGERTKP